MAIRHGIIIVLLLFLLMGCTNNEDKMEVQNDTTESTTAIEEIIQGDERITKAIAVIHGKGIIIAINLKTFARFNKDKIETKLQKELEKNYKDFDVTVSADMKIIQEVRKITKLENKDEVGKKIEKLKSLKEEET